MKVSIPKLHSIVMKGRENVETLQIASRHNIDPLPVLINAINRKLTAVVIIGYDEDGEEFFATSYADGADFLWLLKRAEKQILDIVDMVDE